MKLNSVTAFGALLVLAIVSGVKAAPFTYTVWGEGNGTCAEWTEARRLVNAHADQPVDANTMQKMDRFNSLMSWVEGYITAYNHWISPSGRVTDNTNAEGIEGWLDNYCATHPLDELSGASDHLIDALRAQSR